MGTDRIANWVRTELWDQVPVRISVIDRNFKIVEANRAFAEAYGDWHDRPCYQVYKGRSEHCLRCDAAHTFEDGVVRVRQEEGIAVEDEPSYYLVRVVPIRRGDGSIPYIIEMSTDISKVVKLEREKLEAERLAAVGQTVAGLAHGVKNLLMGLDGGMYMTRSGIETGDPERLVEGWTVLEENVERISSFVKEFLEFSKGRTSTVELCDPNEPARKVIELFSCTARLAGIELRSELQPDIPAAPMDAEDIHTCLANLISNALDACETSENPGGTVTLATHDDGETLTYEVSDDGSGMEYEVMKKVFTNFFSTKSSGKGTGLGLLTTKRIVQEHGGTVSFESEEGRGSLFRIALSRRQLPQIDAPEDAPEPSAQVVKP